VNLGTKRFVLYPNSANVGKQNLQLTQSQQRNIKVSFVSGINKINVIFYNLSILSKTDHFGILSGYNSRILMIEMMKNAMKMNPTGITIAYIS
jgi:hypothetical protein